METILLRGYVLYLDVLLVINFLLDYLLLWATARLGQCRSTTGRLALAAGLGSLYSVLFLIWPVAFSQHMITKVVVSGIMVAVAFRRMALSRFLQALGFFYLVAFAMGGAVLGSIYLFDTNLGAYTGNRGWLLFLIHVPWTWLLLAGLAAWLLGRWGAGLIRRNLIRSMVQVPVVVCIDQHQVPLRALIDTGNNLCDPLTQQPVMIIEYGVIKHLLPVKMQAVLEASAEPDLEQIVDSVAGSSWASRLRLIPFRSLGRQRGMLVGLRPDEVVVVGESGPVKVTDVILGIYRDQLTPEGTYRALLHPAIIQAIGF